MNIKSIYVKNFRSILNSTLKLESLTALVGPNGSGKSSFLKALELFYNPQMHVSEDDYYSCDTKNDIEIELTFHNFSVEEHDIFDKFINNDELTVTRIFSEVSPNKSGRYYGSSFQNKDFDQIRSAIKAMDARKEYKKLFDFSKYKDLPKANSRNEVMEALEKWEVQHPDDCELTRTEKQFFGYMQVGKGYLEKHTRFILIPAIRDAADDASEGRG